MMQRDAGNEDRNKRPRSNEYLSDSKVGPGERHQEENGMSLSQLLEPTPVDPQRMVQVDKLPLYNAHEGNPDLAALVPLLSIPQQDRVAFKAPDSLSDHRVHIPHQSAAKRPRTEHKKSFAKPSSQASAKEPPQGQQGGKSTQLEQWNARYQQLVDFQKEFHHCCVPLNYSKNPSLAHWVKRQRYQYRMKMKQGKHSTLTDERQKALEKLGFVWDSHAAAWEERWSQLNEFRQLYGHSRVPKNYPPNQPLAVWVKCQRRQFKLYRQGMASNMNPERIEKLQILDFVFDPRSGGPNKNKQGYLV